uniref:RRM domain-containing protein n=1 Tax=Strongyloides stercoralis TaxID=6248 RepID=A0A0K0DU41_STRER
MNYISLFSRSLLKQGIRNFNDANKVVYLTHVQWITGKGQIEKYFSKFGKIQDVSLFFDPKTGLHRGYASVEFEKRTSVEEAMKSGPHVIDGSIINVELTVPNFKDSKKFKTEAF